MGAQDDESLSFWMPEMAHYIVLNPTFFWFTRIADTLSTIIILTILCYHCFVLFRHAENQRLSAWNRGRTDSLHQRSIAKRSLTLSALTIGFIVFSLITIFMLMLNNWTPFPEEDYNCNLNVFVLCIAFHLSKALFYAVLIARLDAAFGGSAVGYSKRTILGLFAFVVLYTCLVLVGTPFVVEGSTYESNIPSADNPWCHVHIKENLGMMGQIGILVWIVMDMLISIILLYLFEHPITTLLRLFPDSGHQNHIKYDDLVMKCMILCWVSIISSALALFLYLWRHIATLIELNLPFVCLCVVLMHIKYDDQFRCLCRPCIICYRRTVDRSTSASTIKSKDKDGDGETGTENTGQSG